MIAKNHISSNDMTVFDCKNNKKNTNINFYIRKSFMCIRLNHWSSTEETNGSRLKY